LVKKPPNQRLAFYMDEFIIDRQTINDLAIFADEAASVYSFFNHVKTIGGQTKLRKLIETPSADINILNSRKQTIQYFHQHKLALPLNKKDIDFIEHYLAFNRSPLKPNIFDVSAGKIKNYLSPGSDHYIITQGIKDLHKLLIVLNRFSAAMKTEGMNAAVHEFATAMNNFLAKPAIQKLIATDPEKEQSFLQVSHHDKLFRKTEITNIRTLLNVVYELDVYISIARVLDNSNFCLAEYIDTDECFVNIEGLHHPSIKDAVTNDIEISTKNLLFITGANMAGKSSFLKALGLCVYLAHVGFPVPAKAMRTNVFNGLITTINLADNIGAGYSHYFSEVNRVKQTALLIKEQSKLFVIFDELFRGTNVKDAYDASLAIIKALSKVKNCVFLISTHIVEIAQQLQDIENVRFDYFNAGITGGKPVFDYKLRAGVSSETLGYFIFKNEGIIEILEEAAKNKDK